MAATITRTPMPVRRTSLLLLDEHYEQLEAAWGSIFYPYPFVCHGCSRRLTTGDRYCSLLNTTNAGAYWCADCASVFEREPGY